MRILVTGATGFIGARVVTQLASLGLEVYANTRKSTPPSWASELKNVHWICGDFASLPAGDVEVKRVESCIHLAWYAEPGKYLESAENIAVLNKSVQLLEKLADLGCSCFVGAGTCAEYDTTPGFLRENGPVNPRTLYGSSKLALRYIAEQRCRQLEMNFSWGRIFYLYGPGEHERRVVPSLITTLLQGKIFPASSGEQIRDYLHIDDVASAFVLLATKQGEGVFNISSGTPIRMRGLMKLLENQLDRSDLVRFGETPKSQFDPPFVCGDNSKLMSIGWMPTIELEDGLRGTIAYWRAKLSNQGV